jgi:hypothetical protein
LINAQKRKEKKNKNGNIWFLNLILLIFI